MALPGNLSLKRIVIVLVGSPLLGGFVWGALNPPATWDHLVGRFIHGVLAAPMSLFVMFARPDKLQSWLFIAVAFVFLLFLAIRMPRSRPGAG
jgi:hypothetical protein